MQHKDKHNHTDFKEITHLTGSMITAMAYENKLHY